VPVKKSTLPGLEINILVAVLVPEPSRLPVGEKQRHGLLELSNAAIDATGDNATGPLVKLLRSRKRMRHGFSEFLNFVKRNIYFINRNFLDRPDS
jgi:hypothetical protein